MSVETPEKCAKYERTTQELLQFYVQFCSEHPVLQKGKNHPCPPKLIQSLWTQMADSLNTMRGPTRSVAKWKDTLAAWKNQLRCRARKVHADVTGTGGGPRTADISDFDQQALETFGAATVYGRANMGTFGHATEVVNSSEVVTCECSAPLSEPQNPISAAAALNALLTVPPGVTDCNSRAKISQAVTS